MRFLPLLLLPILLTSCEPTGSTNQQALGEATLESRSPTVLQAEKEATLPTGPNQDTLAVRDANFVEQVFTNYLLYKKVIVSRRQFRLTQQLESSDDDLPLMDTINTFADQRNSFTFLHSGDPTVKTALLLKARILSPAIKLPKNVSVGMSRKEFAAAFHLHHMPSVVMVTEEEGYQLFTFTFGKTALVRIDFVSNYFG